MKTGKGFIRVLRAAAAVFLISVSSAQASTMYVSTAESFYNGAAAGSILTADSMSFPGTVSVLQNRPTTGDIGLQGLEFGLNGKLFGTTYFYDQAPPFTPHPSRLIEINPTDGSLVRDLGVIKTAGGIEIPIFDLAFNPINRMLYGISDWVSGSGYSLYNISLDGPSQMPLATLIGNPAVNQAGGMAFSPDGALYLADMWASGTGQSSSVPRRLLTLDPTNGSVINWENIWLEKNLGDPETTYLSGLGFRPDGTLFGTWDASDEILQRVPGPNGEWRWRILGETHGMVSDIAFQQPVPIPGAAVLLGSGLAALVFVKRRR